jgi:hypothetical protein
MSLQTAELVNALNAVARHIPRVTTELLAGSMSVAKQQEFAGLLSELGELMHEHSDDQDRGIVRSQPSQRD